MRHTISRTHVALAAVALFFALAAPAHASHQFGDVPDDHPFHTEIGVFKDTNITAGCTATTFCPADFVRRQAMAAFIDRALGLVVRPSEGQLRAVPGSRVAMLDDGTSLVRTNSGGLFSGLELSHGGFRVLRLVGHATSPTVIGGSSANAVNAGAEGATIAGGGSTSLWNRVTDDGGTVGGGEGNRAGHATGPDAESEFATVGGGTGNVASADAATVGGGSANTASGAVATVGGGDSNTASGPHATVPGGSANKAAGSYSFAAGRDAQANHAGSFVWNDSLPHPTGSSGTNTFTARATGGVQFVTGIHPLMGYPTAGAYLSAGGGSWSSLSDRAAKRDFRRVDTEALLRRLMAMPITTWSYRSQKRSIRHLGPTAQDFRRAFGLGEDPRHITSVDADGVALAAIQGLYRVTVARQRRIERLERALATTSARDSERKGARP